jgi:hypothetical protein
MAYRWTLEVRAALAIMPAQEAELQECLVPVRTKLLVSHLHHRRLPPTPAAVSGSVVLQQ